jgi:death on curing protein
MVSPTFLTLEAVIAIHRDQLALFGGGDGIRDQGLLESAIAQPMATFDGNYLHEDLHAMAAAYLYHLVQNHPFVDGNKRVGLIATLVFLAGNGISTKVAYSALYDLVIDVASGRIDKQGIAAQLRELYPG